MLRKYGVPYGETKTRAGWVTKTTESLATMASISAQETVWGQMDSISDLIESINSNPLREFTFGAAFFSPVKLGLSSKSTDASHPCNKKE